MKRLKLLALMGLLALLLAGAVVCGSPYAPVVQLVVDIEAIWALEDARTESETPLVHALANHGLPLAYDERQNTFYCTLGPDVGETWPQIHLTAPGAQGVQLVFADDYSYDWCADAIRDGYPYQIFTYTDASFFYTQIVFTSLPVISLTSDTEIPPHEDVPVQAAVSWYGEEAFVSPARAHRRGATSLNLTPKNGLKVNFTRSANGKRTQVSMPFLGFTDEMTLIACSIDPQMIRDKLSWDLYNRMMGREQPFGFMDTHYAELFLNGDYHGVYLLMKQFDYPQEMAKGGAAAALSDSFYRMADHVIPDPDRPVIVDHNGHSYEQHHAPAWETDFQSIRPYLALTAEEDDAVFSRKVLEMVDLDSVIRYALFIEACGMTDNEFNNLCIWAHQSGEGVKYRFVPWDLDVSWGLDDERNTEIWYSFDVFNRMVSLDCGGVRARMLEIWQEMRSAAFNQETMEELMAQYDAQLNGSGAFYRNAQRWERIHEMLDTYDIYAYSLARFDMMDRRIAEIASPQLKNRRVWMDQYETTDMGPLDDALRGL